MEKIKLITIAYDEYLELLDYKEMVDEAKKDVRVETSFSPSIHPYGYTRQQIRATKLFNELVGHPGVKSIEIVRDK